jgi:polyisoprenoid-binding protein YceI
MKRSLLILALALGANHLNAQHFTPVDEGSNVKFIIKNFGLNVTGEFKGLKGDISFDPDKLSSASFVASVDAATVNTGNGSRDRHLRKEEYLFVEKFL